MDRNRRRSRKKVLEAECPACGHKMTQNLREKVKQIEVKCTKCATRFWLSFHENPPKIQRDFEAGDDFHGQWDRR